MATLSRFLARPLAMYSPHLGPVARAARCLERAALNRVSAARLSETRDHDFAGTKVYRHQSVLVRRHGQGRRGIELQHNKVRSLRLAVAQLQNVCIDPGETFSFWHLVGRPTKRRGFAMGMELSAGRPQEGIGGGLCQLSNLIFWLALHSPLRVAERHHHSFDPFPDDGRILPFGSGATVMYLYKDLRLSNETSDRFHLRFWFDRKCLNGVLSASALPCLSHSVFERRARFERAGGVWRRRNELWRRVRKRATGQLLREEFLFENDAEVCYAPSGER